MRTPLIWPTAVRQPANNTYTKKQNPSASNKSGHIADDFYIPAVDLFFIIVSASLFPVVSGHSVCVDLIQRSNTLNRPFLLETRIMLKRLLYALQSQSRFFLPAAGLLMFTCLGWTYRQQTPLLETPDEPSHFEVINYMAQHNLLPPRSSETRTGPAPTVSEDVPFYHAPPLYYLFAASLVGQADSQFAQAVIPNPNFERGIGLNLADGVNNKNMYVHTSAQTPPNLEPWARAMQRVRLLSLAFGLATVLGTWALARQIWPQNWQWQATAVALIIFNPTFLYISNGVTNDSLLIALCTWSFVLMGSLLRTDDPRVSWREWALALLLGATILTKQTGFILLPPALLVVIVRARHMGWTRRRLWLVVAGGLVVITAVGGWWYLFNGVVYGDLLALESHRALPPVESIAERLQFSLAQSWGAFKSFWAAFGWATIFVHPLWYAWFATLTVLGLTGWFWHKRLAQSDSTELGLSKEPFTRLPQVLWLGVLLNAGLMLVWLWRTAAPYGRLLFPVIAPLSCLLVLGWQHWLARLRWPDVAGQLGLVLPLAALALLVPFGYLQPAFAPVATPPDRAADYLPLDATFGQQFHLLGYTIAPETLQAGNELTLTFFWRLADPAADPGLIESVIQVAPLDPEAQVTAVSELLGTSRYPAPFWQTDEIIVQRHTLTLAEDTPAPSLYWFDLILVDEIMQARLPVVWQGELLADSLLRIGPEPILLEGTAVSTPTNRASYTFGQQIQLNGYDLRPAANEAGLELTLFWQALAQPTADWTVFVHLVDENGSLVAQGDGVPRDGNFPTQWWPTGTHIPDTHRLAGEINCDALSQYRLLLGFYNPVTDERLPVSGVSGQLLPNNAVEIQPTCSIGSS